MAGIAKSLVAVYVMFVVGAAVALCSCASADGSRESRETIGSTTQALGTVTLTAGSFTSSGHDFSTQTYTGQSGGDFYFSNAKFWANNIGQRGVKRIGTCASVDSITTMPTSGYTRFGVPATAGYCYVALTHFDERDHIVFRVDTLNATTAVLTWKIVPSGYWGATLTSGDHSSGGYDFSTKTYTDLTPGDFYFVDGGFWANNSGQRGVISVGPCTSLAAVKTVPLAGYSTFNVPVTAGNCYVALTHNEEHQNIVFRVEELTGPTTQLTWKLVDDCYGLTDPRKHVNCWLTMNPAVASYVRWENRVSLGVTSVAAWSAWTNAQRDDLRKNVANYINLLKNTITQDPDPLADPLVNQATLTDNSYPYAVLSTSDAWRLYVKTVAMSLAVEMNAYAPWSVKNYAGTSLTALFDSRNLAQYTWSGRPENLGVPTPSVEGYILVTNNYDPNDHAAFVPIASTVLPAPPDKALQFTRDKSLKGTTRNATIVKTLEWSARLHHYVGGQTAVDFERVWQYRGPAPVTRTIAATLDPGSGNPDPLHYTAGCSGTSGFLHSILRTLNIPVDWNYVVGHSLTRFMTEKLTLSHGDDPYIGYDIYGVPMSALLLTEAKYNSWFKNKPDPVAVENRGRGNPEAMIKNVSGQLQWLYCHDPVPGADHAHSQVLNANVFTQHPNTYTLSYLENLPADTAYPGVNSLWGRIAQKVAAGGGCATVIGTISAQMGAYAAVLPVSERVHYNW